MTRKLIFLLLITLLALTALPVASAEKTLTLVSCDLQLVGGKSLRTLAVADQRYQQALDKFTAAHPDITIEHRTIDAYPGLMDALANEQGADLIAAYNVDLADYQRKGLLVDLAKEPIITEKLERYPSLQMFTEGEALVAIPYATRFARLRVLSVSTLETLDITAPTEAWTWDDLFKLGEKVAEYNAANGTEYKLLAEDSLPYCIEQYLNNALYHQEGPAAFDTPAFRALLTGYRYLVDNNLIMVGSWQGIGPTPVFELVYMNPRFNSYTVPIPAYEEGIRAAIATTRYYMVSANSEQKDLALEFLSYLIDPEIAPHGALYHEYDANGIWLKGDGSEEVRSLYEAEWLLPYEQATRHTVTTTETLATVLVRSYLRGEITQDVCVNLLETYIKAVENP